MANGTLTMTNTTIYDLALFETFATARNSAVASIGNTFDSTITDDGGNLLGVDPQLAPLGDFGGSTPTRPPLTNSPAINGGVNALVPVDLLTDQRGPGFLRIILGTVDVGAVEFNEYDFGDAPDTYGTLLASNGAGHFATGPALGATRESETDGQPTADATGDGADEDGVTAAGPLVVGQTTNITINVSAPGFVNAWTDLNRDGDFDDVLFGEQFLTNFAVVAGDNVIPFAIPANFTPGQNVSRYRLTSASVASPSPTGALPDGEVEDYVGTILGVDFGDAPIGYPTTLAENGARHVATGPMLGTARDTEADGTHSANADADDATGTSDDEDGVVATGPIVAGSVTNIEITSSAAGFVNAWADLNRDGDFNDVLLGEQFQTNTPVAAGVTTIPFFVPVEFPAGNVVVRYRLTSQSVASPSPTGLLPDGEVEDTIATILDQTGPAFTSLATSSILENTTAVLNVTATDPSTPVTFSIPSGVAGGPDGAKFVIHSTTGALSFLAAPDFESPTDVGTNNIYNVTVLAMDGVGNVRTQNIAVTVNDAADLSDRLIFKFLSSTSIDLETVTGGTSSTQQFRKLRPYFEFTQTAPEIVFQLPATSNSARLFNDIASDSRMQFKGTGLPHIIFSSRGVSSLVINGGDNHNVITVSGLDGLFTGTLTINGGGGNDTIRASAVSNAMRVDGGLGNDVIDSGRSDDTLTGGAGKDVLKGAAGNDRLFGGSENDNLDGGAGNDTLLGEAGNDTLTGGEGHDGLNGGANNDKLDGGKGNDTLVGDDGTDSTLTTAGGKDTLLGGTGADICLGGGGDDSIDGGTAPGTTPGTRDTVAGHQGTDIIKDRAPEIDEAFTFNFSLLLL